MNNAIWFGEARYGMFIHSGAYSVTAPQKQKIRINELDFQSFPASALTLCQFCKQEKVSSHSFTT